MVRQIVCPEIDINNGYANTVEATVNEQLLLIQQKGGSIIQVSAPLVSGRKVYLTIEYDDPNIDLSTDEPDAE